MPACDDITRLLHAIDEDRTGAMDALMEAVYADLEHVARRHMDRQFGRGLPGVTLEPAALVNESFLRLIRQRKRYANREQFFAIATRIMLRVLIDYQRQRLAAKRGGSHKRITLSLEGPAAPVDAAGARTMIGVDTLVSAVDELESLDRRKADVVKLRVIWGLEMREIAAALDVSLATVERDWSFAKAWLARAADAGGPTNEADGPDEASGRRAKTRP
jgi:RNA polymerase sigma-70 factor (ECF subfamily)